MGTAKIRMSTCDARGCGTNAIHVKDRLPLGWEWWHITWPLTGGLRIKLAVSKAYDMYLLCPACSASEEIPDV
jgi:hypothetical protein